MRKLRFLFSLTLTFVRRFYLVLLGGALFGVVIFLAIRFVSTRLFPTNIVYIGAVGRYHTDELPEFLLSQVGEGLTKLDDHGLPTPSLAKSWKTPDAGKTWEFDLDTSKKWQDGTPVTSNTINYSFEDVTIDRPDDHTIVFKLASPYAPFPVVVARPVFKQGLLGTGEWTAQGISLSGGYVSRVEFVNKEGIHHLYKFYTSEDAAITAFNLGQIDRIERLMNVDAFKGWNTVKIEENKDNLRYTGIFFDTVDGAFKDNKPLRQAVSYAINKDLWSQNRAVSVVPDDSWAFNSQVKPYDYDVAHANDLLKTIVKKGEVLKVTLLSSPNLLAVADKIATDWEKVGIATSVQIANEVPQSYDAFLSEYDVSLDPDQYLTWHSTQTDTNITHYNNRRIDKLLEDGRLEMDPEKRKKEYLDFQRFLLEDVPVLPLYHPIFYTVTRI